MRRVTATAVLLLFSIAHPHKALSQDPATPAEISADLGPCSALITVIDADAKPVVNARMTTHLQYGMMGARKLDLEAYSGADGKLKITHLPASLKKPMIIHIAKGDKEDQVEFKPAERCDATFNVSLK